MKILKILGIAIVVVVVAVVAIGLMMPSKWSVEQNITVNAPQNNVTNYIVDLKRWEEWTAWTKAQDPTIVYTISTPSLGVGANMSWTSKMGEGKLVITEITNTSLSYDLFFDKSQTPNKGTFKWDPKGNVTTVNWTHSGDVGNHLMQRFMISKIKDYMNKDFSTGLTNLKQKAESLYAEMQRREQLLQEQQKQQEAAPPAKPAKGKSKS